MDTWNLRARKGVIKMMQETNKYSNEQALTADEFKVEELVRGGMLLVNIINSSKYTRELKNEALRRMRANVLCVQAGEVS